MGREERMEEWEERIGREEYGVFPETSVILHAHYIIVF